MRNSKYKTIFSLVFFTLLVSAAIGFTASAEQNDGVLIKASTDAVYYLDQGKRYVFPNERIYHSWYKDFSDIVTVTDQELASYQIGGVVFYRPGTRLVKITTDPKVYAVGPNGVLMPLKDEATAIALYGAQWASRVDDLSDAFFSAYTVGETVTPTQHPEGTIFRYQNGNTVYYLDRLNSQYFARPISAEQQQSMRLQESFILRIQNSFGYTTGSNLEPGESLAIPTQREGAITPAIPTTATITLTRAASLPSAIEVVAGSNDPVIFSFTLRGDTYHEVSLNRMDLEFFVDAAGNDKDFARYSDLDERTEWAINQLINDLKIVRRDTGQTMGTATSISTASKTTVQMLVEIAAGQEITFDITADPNIAPTPTPRFSVDFAATDLQLTSRTAESVSTTLSSTTINGQLSPLTIVTPKQYGKLTVDSTVSQGDDIIYFNETRTAFRLVFTSRGEAFTVKSLGVEMTNRGDDFTAVEHLQLQYEDSNGNTITAKHAFLNGNVFQFTPLDIYVPANATVEVPVMIDPSTASTSFSFSRLQLAFSRQYFSVETKISRQTFTGDNFVDATKLSDSTDDSPVFIFANAEPVIERHPETPSGPKTRYSSTEALIFTAKATHGDVYLKKLSFKIETSNVSKAGSENDLLERLSLIAYQEVGNLYSYDGAENDTVVSAASRSFVIFSKQQGELSDPTGYETQKGDYGIYTIEFGGAGYRINEGVSRHFVFKLNTTGISNDESADVQVTLLGDDISKTAPGARFIWTDGSTPQGSGYLVGGIPLSGNRLTYSKLTAF